MKVLIIKNISHEGPGLIRPLLDGKSIKYDIIDLSNKVLFPNIDQYSLIIIMGGPDSANDKSDKILKELDYIKLAIMKQKPILGICLGLQLIIKALGGKVYKNPIQEKGFKIGEKWNNITLTTDGMNDPIFKGIKYEFEVFHLHGETVNLIEKVKLLGRGEYCENQILKIDKWIYGFQFHFELTGKMFKNWLDLAPELKGENKFSLLNDWYQLNEVYIDRGIRIISNFLNLIEEK